MDGGLSQVGPGVMLFSVPVGMWVSPATPPSNLYCHPSTSAGSAHGSWPSAPLALSLEGGPPALLPLDPTHGPSELDMEPPEGLTASPVLADGITKGYSYYYYYCEGFSTDQPGSLGQAVCRGHHSSSHR